MTKRKTKRRGVRRRDCAGDERVGLTPDGYRIGLLLLFEATPIHVLSLSLTTAHREELATFKAGISPDSLRLMQSLVGQTVPTMVGVAAGIMAPIQGDKIDFDLPRFQAELDRIVLEGTATDATA